MMGNVKLILVILLSISTIASSVEVISIDINNYGNDVAYTGEAAVPGATEWVAYYGGWGIPVGSPRSANLAETGTIQASTYAEQVWLGDPGNHAYITGAGDGLMDDGFDPNTPTDPNLAFIGLDLFGDAADHAYGGTFDVYIYSNSGGTFTLTDVNDFVIADPNTITGTTSGFVEGQNYVLFEGVSIADPNSVRLVYSGELNGIQLVSTKQTPKVINPSSSDPNDYMITVSDWDVAYDTNAREDEDGRYGFGSFYGPDFYPGWVGILYTGDAMEYDIAIDAAAQGEYNLTIDMETSGSYGDATLDFFLDGIPIGSLTGVSGYSGTVGPLAVNLFEGTHTLKWQSNENGHNIGDIVLDRIGNVSLDDCEEVQAYGKQPAGDVTGDCRVNLDDLVLMASEWTADYSAY